MTKTRCNTRCFACLVFFIVSTYSQPIIKECSGPGDIIFIVDGSDSLTSAEFHLSKQFVIDTIDHLILGPNKVRVGVMAFSRNVTEVVALGSSHGTGSIKKKIEDAVPEREGTWTHLAITAATDSLLAKRRAPGIPSIGIVISDGKSKFPGDTINAAVAAAQQSVTLIAVGVGTNRNNGELRIIANYVTDNILTAANYSDLNTEAKLGTMTDIICREATTTTSTTTTTTTTTTTAPLITAPIVGPDDDCEGCIISQGFGYNPYDIDCSMFVVCRVANNGATLIHGVERCPFGLLWDQQSLTCNYPAKTTCANDICASQNDGFMIPVFGWCQAYYLCEGGRSYPKCCGNGMMFAFGQGCMADLTGVCQNQCAHPATTTAASVSCDKSYSKPGFYFWTLSGFGQVEMPCPPGTDFEQSTCGCITNPLAVVVTECKSMIHLTFNDHLLDGTGDVNSASMINVQHMDPGPNGYAQLTGNSYINVWRTAHAEFRNVVIRFRLRPTTAGTSFQSVLRNCFQNNNNDDMDPPIEMLTDFGNSEVWSKLVTDDTESGYTPISYNQWNEVLYAYDGSVFLTRVGTQYTALLANGMVHSSQSGIVIGLGRGVVTELGISPGNYTGDIDELEIYGCIPDDVMTLIDAARSGATG